MAERVFSYDEVFAAMCIMEEIADPQLKDAPTPWQDYRDMWGIGGLRDAVISKLAHACDQAWDRAKERYETKFTNWGARREAARLRNEHTGAWEPTPEWLQANPEPTDPGSFDYEFVPMWIRLCVDWSDLNEGPRVKGTTVSEASDG